MSDRAIGPPNGAEGERRLALIAWHSRDTHRAFWNLPLTLGLMLCVGILLLRGTAEDAKANYVQSKAAVLALAPPAVPKGENAADDYAAAQSAKIKYKDPNPNAKPGWSSRTDPSMFLSATSTYYEAPATVQFYNDNEPAVALLHTGAAKPRCDWKLDYAAGMAMRMPGLAHARDSARLLAGHARIRAHAGDHAAAAKDIAAIYAMAGHVETDPLLISGLVSIAMSAIADGTVQAIITWDTPTNAADIEAYRRVLWQPRNATTRAARHLESEKLVSLYMLDGLFAGATPAASLAGLGLPPSLSAGTGAIMWYGGERRCDAGVMDEIIAGARALQPISNADTAALVDRHQTGTALFAGMMAQVCSRAIVSFGRSEEQARVTDAGLAMLLFRLKHGRDPKAFDELVPEFLPGVPRAAFHDEPLRLRVDPEGVTASSMDPLTGERRRMRRDRNVLRVYTRGENGKDDGGHNWDEPTRGGEPREDDAAFCVPPIVRTPPEPMAPIAPGAW